MHAMLTGALGGVALAVLLYYFEYASIMRAAKERSKRKTSRVVEMDGSEQSRLRNLGWFCLVLPAMGAGLGWLLG